jgi:hypothetical protein
MYYFLPIRLGMHGGITLALSEQETVETNGNELHKKRRPDPGRLLLTVYPAGLKFFFPDPHAVE